jgi:hypothetical protein
MIFRDYYRGLAKKETRNAMGWIARARESLAHADDEAIELTRQCVGYALAARSEAKRYRAIARGTYA